MQQREPKLDLIALMAGVGFVGVGLVSLVSQGTALEARWTWPLLLILIGVVGLFASRRPAREAGPMTPPAREAGPMTPPAPEARGTER